MELITSLVFISLIISLLFSFSKHVTSSRNAPRPPGPAGIPIFGNLIGLARLGSLPHRSLTKLARVYGPVMSLKLGLTTAVVISSPEAAREVLQKKDASFSARSLPDSFRAVNYHEASTIFLPSTSPIWKRNRVICNTHLFSARSIEAAREIREKKAYNIMKYFHKTAGHPVEIGNIIYLGMLNVMSNVLLSQDVIDIFSEESRESSVFSKESVNVVTKPNVSDFFPFLRLLDLQGTRRASAHYFREYYRFFDKFIDARLQHRSNGGDNYGDFLDTLVDLLAESKITRREIHVLLTELFGGGSDSSAITVEWAMVELLRDPVAMAKAQDEVRTAFALKVLEELEVMKLPYLQAVFKEVMRLHPPGPLLPHYAMEDGLDICGYRVPKGTSVIVNVWAIERDPRLWEEPDMFRPERFLDKQINLLGRDFEFIPFGSGRRICVGLSLAVRMVPFVLALMLREFDWRLPGGMEAKDVDLTEQFSSVVELAVPLKAVPIAAVK